MFLLKQPQIPISSSLIVVIWLDISECVRLNTTQSLLYSLLLQWYQCYEIEMWCLILSDRSDIHARGVNGGFYYVFASISWLHVSIYLYIPQNTRYLFRFCLCSRYDRQCVITHVLVESLTSQVMPTLCHSNGILDIIEKLRLNYRFPWNLIGRKASSAPRANRGYFMGVDSHNHIATKYRQSGKCSRTSTWPNPQGAQA